MTTIIRFTLNDRPVEVQVDPRTLLVDVLRDGLGLTGTHVGCAYGVCGACTIIVDGLPARSCLMLAAQAEAKVVVTVEGLAPQGEITALQTAFHEEHGLQCGFCTSGLLCSLAALQQGDAAVSRNDVDDAISGHLCRCTGYVGIRRAAHRAFGVVPGTEDES